MDENPAPPPPPPLQQYSLLHHQQIWVGSFSSCRIQQSPNSERDTIFPCAVKSGFKTRFRILSVEITRIGSHFSFDKIWVGFTLQIGDKQWNL
jgi:hypothetical protein